MSRLEEHAKLQREGLGLHLDDVQDTEITINEVKFNMTQYGELAVMEVEIPDHGSELVGTFAMLVVDALKNAKEANAFPLEARFVKDGRIWRIE